MKKFTKLLAVLIFLLVAFAAPMMAQGIAVKTDYSMWLEFIQQNSIYLIPILVWIVNRFAPTKWKDPIVMLLQWLNTRIPDKKAGGGKHNK